MRVRRQCQLTISTSRDLLATAYEMREQLRESITVYAAELRRNQVLPERAIVLVKSAVLESAPLPDLDYRAMVEDAVRWAVDAYYAA